MFKGLKIFLLLIVLLISRLGISSFTPFIVGSAVTSVSAAGNDLTDVNHMIEMPVENLEGEDFSEKIGRQLNAVAILPFFSAFSDFLQLEFGKAGLVEHTVVAVNNDKHILNRVFRI